MNTLTGKKIAILTENGFEEVELTSPKSALEAAGAIVHIISPQPRQVTGWNKDHWSIELPVNVTIDKADADDYDALILPGGVINPDLLRTNEDAVEFVSQFIRQHKPVAAICHGPQLLIETGLLEGRTLTSTQSIKTDLQNAGAFWQDREVVVDHGLISSRGPKDLDAFNAKIIEEIKESIHAL